MRIAFVVSALLLSSSLSPATAQNAPLQCDGDVTIVRALLVPSAMKLFDKWNWWLPEGLARVIRVPASPLGEHRPALRPAGK